MTKKKRDARRAAKIAVRKLERKERQIDSAREKLYALSPGGSPERPLVAPTSSVIETRAKAIACPICGGRLVIDEHTVDRETRELLRLVRAHCQQCGATRRIWFRLQQASVN